MEMLRTLLTHASESLAAQPLRVQAVIALASLVAMSFGPGMLILGRLRMRPLEKLACAAGLSLAICYVAGFALFLGAASVPMHLLIPAGSLVCAILAVPSLFRLLRQADGWRAIAGFVIVLLWSGIVLATIRHFSGLAWSYDWIEHHDRVKYFLNQLPLDYVFLGQYQGVPHYLLAERPPIQNMLAATAIGPLSPTVPFELVQIAFLYLNTLLFLPMFWLARTFGGRRAPVTVALVALFMCNPMLLQNSTYLWTKVLSAFYVLLATGLYLRGWKRRDALRMMGAIGALAAAAMVHYSAVVYGIALACHYLLAVFWRPRRRRWSEVIGGLAIAAVLAGPWFFFCYKTFGFHQTFAGNVNITRTRAGGLAASIEVRASNFISTLVPHPLRSNASIPPQVWYGHLRDWAFGFYQSSFPISIGLAAALAAMAWWVWRTRSTREPGAIAQIAATLILGFLLAALCYVGLGLTKAGDGGMVLNIGVGGAHFLRLFSTAVAAGVCFAALAFLILRGLRLALPRNGTPIRRFWFFFILSSAILGCSLPGHAEPYGQAQLCLQPLTFMGIALVAANVHRMGVRWRLLLAAGALVDFSLGILLHARVQSLPFTFKDGLPNNPYPLFERSFMNWADKLEHQFRYVGDHLTGRQTDLLSILLVAGAAAAAVLLVVHRRPRPTPTP